MTTPVSMTPDTEALPESRRHWLRDVLSGLFLTLAVILVYQPVQYAGYIWDDDDHLTANPTIIGPLGFKDIWTSRAADIAPLTRSTFWLEHWLWGLNPLPYHLVNVALHAACAIILWRVLLRLRVPGAWLGAALWALHPVMVESVAWITEMKNTESGVFFLASILFFLHWLEDGKSGHRRWGSYTLTLLFAALAMASKSSTVMLPVILCLCVWWMEDPRQWRPACRRMAGTIPVFLMSIVTSGVAVWLSGLPPGPDADVQPFRTLPQRLVAAGDALWFYLEKLIWPNPVMTGYPRWDIDAKQWFAWLPLLAAVGLLVFLWRKRESWSRPYFFALACFTTALLPVLGLVDHYILRYSLVFDHFQYLAAMAPLAFAGAGIAALADSVKGFTPSGREWLRTLICAAVLVVLGAMSWQRTWVFRNEQTLWSDTLSKNPGSWFARYNLGNEYFKAGEIDQAVVHYQQALELHPGYVRALTNLGTAFMAKRQPAAALAYYREAVSLSPAYAEAHNNLANTLATLGHFDQAIAEYQSALRLDPDYRQARENLARAQAAAARIAP